MTRVAIIFKEKCHPTECGNYWCVGACPVNRTGKECIVKSPDGKVKIIEEACIGCGICLKCPFDALKIVNLPEKLKESPTHRYGENKFELFRLPLPKQKTVVGIIGRNGIGKSTALQILAGQLKPNFGNFIQQPLDEEIFKRYAGTQFLDYFKRLFNGTLKVSYKPQRVELLPKIISGTLGSLVKKVDEVAKKEYRNRSELIREALRVYLTRIERWEKILKTGKEYGKKMGIKSEKDVNRIISEYRHGK